jgi:23S rRNA (uracil1939-C5)-methyltransferase
MGSADEEQLLEALRKKLGAPQKRDERKELENLFGKKKVAPEDKLREKLKRPSLEHGDEIHLSIQKLALGGRGLGRHKGAAVFVPDAVPGDTLRVRINKTKENAVFEGEPLELISPSSNRVQPRCKHFGDCGGCSLQHFAYTAQIKAKQEMVIDVLRSVGGVDFPVRTPIASPEHYHYRLRAKLHVVQDNGILSLGFKASKSNRVIPVKMCPILTPVLNRILERLPDLLPDPGTNTIPSTIHLHASADESHVVMHLESEKPIYYAEDLLAACHQAELPVKGISSETSSGNTAVGDVLVQHKVKDTVYWIQGRSFFQANRYLLSTLLNQAILLASPSSRDHLLDLYCGCGFFTLPFSRYLAKSYGLDSDPSAIDCAVRNQNENSIENCTFSTCSDDNFFNDLSVPDTYLPMIIVDPPRQGMPQSCVDKIVRRKPSKLLYISCNPSQFARDLSTFLNTDFRLRVVQPVDLFPHTHHIELLAFLTHVHTGPQAASTSIPDLH